MSDDYLWDGSGPPDPEIQRLEQMLGKLKTTAPTTTLRTWGPASAAPARVPTRWTSARFLGPALAAAAAIVMMVGVTWQTTLRPVAGWDVAATIGAPRIGASALRGSGRLAVGDTLVTDGSSRAQIDVSTIGQVTVDENSSVRLVETRAGRHRLSLDRGTLHAVIAAPPGEFIVDTPSATATDLGCVYSLHVDEDGSGVLSVAAGWVAFEYNGRESFVPAGASSRTHPRLGPGTPVYDDAEERFRNELDMVDAGEGYKMYGDALAYVLEHARPRDAMTLWHLVPRVSAADRGAVVDALAARVAMPSSVARDAVMRLDHASMDQWWDALGLLDTTWWRKWKGPVPQ
jgi:FecR-like protein